jgi:hypothetical protein
MIPMIPPMVPGAAVSRALVMPRAVRLIDAACPGVMIVVLGMVALLLVGIRDRASVVVKATRRGRSHDGDSP